MSCKQNFVLFADTDMDMTLKIAKEYGYAGLISMPYTLEDKEVWPYQDFQTFNAHEFYEKLRHGATPTTSGLSPYTYEQYFEPYFKQGKDIMYVHFSETMSGTFSAMQIALEELHEKYPARKFYSIDTKAISIGGLAIAREIGQLYQQGKSAEEIISWAQDNVEKFATYFFATNLSFFRRSGRVKALTAIFGNLLGIKPVINMGSDGVMKSIDKAVGTRGVVAKIMSYVEKLQDNIAGYQILIAHADCMQTAKLVEEQLTQKFGKNLNIRYVDVNPTAGAHCGPDAVGVCFHAIHR